ncbi:aldehyde dehydrogenase [Xylariaceae sp. FL1651]|nr:aldehyde dehydrogenase [Xylariaceae sp. FL1651]
MELFKEIETPQLKYEQPLGLFIDNEFVPGVEGKVFDTINPHNEQVITSVCEGTATDVDIAVKSARAALNGAWKSLATVDRGKLILKLADLLERDVSILANIEALDNGKTVGMAAFDVMGSANTLRYYGGWADKIYGQTIDIDENSHTYTLREPIGVCAGIIPWNFPILMMTWKLGPALATGNTMILKPAEQTPLSALYIAKLIHEAGFPPGVVNIVNGRGPIAGAALAAHMDIDKIAFTGSTAVGRTIMTAAAKSNLKKVTLELGGKSPNIVFPDANLDNALSWVNFGIYYNHGQACCAGSRILVHEAIYDDFIARFRARAEQNKVGDPFAPDTFQGPQVSKVQFDRVMGYIEQGKAAGAKLETGGSRLGEKGYYIQPTIFSDVKEDMSIVREEIFGPVCTVQKFKDEDEAIRLANDSSYGLASAVHTMNVNTATRVAKRLQAGTVWINNYNLTHQQVPFGGYKQSGNGRELGSYALDNYTQIKAVRLYLGDAMFG